MKKLLSLLLCLCLVLSLAACTGKPAPTAPPTEAPTTVPTAPPTEPPTEPPMTVETLLAEMETAMAATPITNHAVSFGFSMTIGLEMEGMDLSLDIGAEMSTESAVAADGTASYTNSASKINMLGTEIEEITQLYTLVEDGTVVVYTYSSTMDQWTFESTGMTPEEYGSLSTNNDWLLELDPATVTLDEMVQELNGSTVYILCTDSVTSFSESMAEAMAGSIDEALLADVSVPTTVWVDTETFLPVQVNLNIQAMMDVLAASLAESLVGETAADAEITITTQDVNASFGYEEVEVPTLPQEALDYIGSNEGSLGGEVIPYEGQATDLGNGTFVLPCGDEALLITCPAGWYGSVYAYDNIWFYSADFSQDADVYYLTDCTEDDILAWIQSDADTMKDWDMFLSSGDGPACEGYTTAVVMGVEESYCYAWTEMGEGYLLVILGDYIAEPDFETQLHDFLALIGPYTGEFQEYTGALDLGDGSFSLPCGSETVILTCPDGWYGSVSMDTAVGFYNDYAQYADFYYLDTYTEEDVMDYWIQYDVDMMKSDETFISFEEADIDMYTAWVLRGDNTSYYYAYRQVGDGCLLLQIMDLEESAADGMEVFQTMIDCISYE